MGYCGFGMQAWIYRKKPRKAFKKQKELQRQQLYNSGTGDNKNKEDTIKQLCYSKEELLFFRKRKERQFLEERKKKVVRAYTTGTTLTLLALGLVVIGISFSTSMDRNLETLLQSEGLSNRNPQTLQNFRETMSEGTRLFKENKFDQALKHYCFASNLFPENKAALYQISRANTRLCFENQENCTTAKNALAKIINKYPDSKELRMMYRNVTILAEK